MEPKFNWKAKKGKLYTVMMVDMDSPFPGRRHLFSPFVHLLVVNVKGPSDWYKKKMSKTGSVLPTSKEVRHVVTTLSREALWNPDNMAEFVKKHQKNIKPLIVPFVSKVSKKPVKVVASKTSLKVAASPSKVVPKVVKVPKLVAQTPKYVPQKIVKQPSMVPVKIIRTLTKTQVVYAPSKIPVQSYYPRPVSKVSKVPIKPKQGQVKVSLSLPPSLAAISNFMDTAPIGLVNIKQSKPKLFKVPKVSKRWTPRLFRAKRSATSAHKVVKSSSKTVPKVVTKAKTAKVPTIVKPQRAPHPIIIRSNKDGDLKGDYVLRYYQPTHIGKLSTNEFHRMVLLVFEQPKRLSKVFAPPFNFDVKQFAEQHKLGAPIAGNYFFSKMYVTRKVVVC